MKKEVGIYEAKTHFSELLLQVMSGNQFVITKSNQPVAKLVPIHKHQRKRRFGGSKGPITLTDAFFEPLPNDIGDFFNPQK